MVPVEVDMIQQQVTLCSSFDKISEIQKWCRTNIGTQAMERDQVTESKPWCVKLFSDCDVWYFAIEKDAAWFALRWA